MIGWNFIIFGVVLLGNHYFIFFWSKWEVASKGGRVPNLVRLSWAVTIKCILVYWIHFAIMLTDVWFELIILLCSMCTVKGGLADDLHEFIPNICTESPAPGREIKQSQGLLDFWFKVKPFASHTVKSLASLDILQNWGLSWKAVEPPASPWIQTLIQSQCVKE